VCNSQALVDRQLDRVAGEKDGDMIEVLVALHYRCSDPVVTNRPGFGEVCDVLQELWVGWDHWMSNYSAA